MKKNIIVATACIFVFACNEKKKPETDIIPYTQMLGTEIKELEETPIIINLFSLDTLGRIVDSTTIDRKSFITLTKTFIEPDITKKEYNPNYIKSVYDNASTNKIDLTYTTTEDKMEVRSLIVSTSKEELSKFSSLLISKKYKKGKATIEEQLYWESKNYCLINIFTTENGSKLTNSKKIVWGLQKN